MNSFNINNAKSTIQMHPSTSPSADIHTDVPRTTHLAELRTGGAEARGMQLPITGGLMKINNVEQLVFKNPDIPEARFVPDLKWEAKVGPLTNGAAYNIPGTLYDRDGKVAIHLELQFIFDNTDTNVVTKGRGGTSSALKLHNAPIRFDLTTAA